MSSTVISFNPGDTGRSMKHLQYISRETAVQDGMEGVLLRNMPEDISEARNFRELRDNLVANAWVREKSEIGQHKGRGEVRTHYRVLVSFEREIDSKRAKELINEWLDKTMPKARVAAFIHRDTDHTHAHIWVDARQVDGRKIHLSKKNYKNLGTNWNRIYSREIGRDEREYFKRIEHNRSNGKTRNSKEQIRQMFSNRELRNAGGRALDQAGARTSEREIAIGGTGTEVTSKSVSRGERDADTGKQTIERANSEVNRTLREIEGLRDQIKRRDISRGRDR